MKCAGGETTDENNLEKAPQRYHPSKKQIGTVQGSDSHTRKRRYKSKQGICLLLSNPSRTHVAIQYELHRTTTWQQFMMQPLLVGVGRPALPRSRRTHRPNAAGGWRSPPPSPCYSVTGRTCQEYPKVHGRHDPRPQNVRMEPVSPSRQFRGNQSTIQARPGLTLAPRRDVP